MMVSKDQAGSVSERIFAEPDLHVYAVLDGASVEGLVGRLWKAEAEYFCLMPGELEPDMMEVAPYVVELAPDADLAAWIIGEGWGKHWGVFAASPKELRTMRGHLRSILNVMDEDGRPLLFRYYDPRVLREFLPTCSGDELKEMFGSTSVYYVEAEDPSTLLAFRLRGGALAKQEIKLADK